jgi:hypothetical protein
MGKDSGVSARVGLYEDIISGERAFNMMKDDVRLCKDEYHTDVTKMTLYVDNRVMDRVNAWLRKRQPTLGDIVSADVRVKGLFGVKIVETEMMIPEIAWELYVGD